MVLQASAVNLARTGRINRRTVPICTTRPAGRTYNKYISVSCESFAFILWLWIMVTEDAVTVSIFRSIIIVVLSLV